MAWFKCCGGSSGGSKITPTFTETLIADNTLLSADITFNETWKNYQILKFVLCETGDTSNQRVFYMLSSQLERLADASLRLRVHFDSGYTQYVISDTELTRKLTANFTIYSVSGLTANNCTVSETVLFNAGSALNTETDITNIAPFDYDLIFVTVNFSSNDGMASRSIIAPYEDNEPFKEFMWFYVGYDWGYNQHIYLTDSSMSSAKYYSVTGINFT